MQLVDVTPDMPLAKAAAAYLNIAKARGTQLAELAELEGILREVQDQIADNKARGSRIENELNEARARLRDGVSDDEPVKAYRAGENRALITFKGVEGAKTVLVELAIPNENFDEPAPVVDAAEVAPAPVVEEVVPVEEPIAEESAIEVPAVEEQLDVVEGGEEEPLV